MLPYELIRTNRKTVAIQIDRAGKLIVRAPRYAPLKQIEAFIRQKEAWILQKQEEAALAVQRCMPLTGSAGERILYGGVEMTLSPGDMEEIAVADGQLLLPVGSTPEDIRRWLKERAGEQLTVAVRQREGEMGVVCDGPKLSDAKSRWGSCSGKNTVRLSWRLVMCPPEVMDYVVVHELCHVRHKNHSREFWAAVERYCPEWREYRRWLRAHGEIMERI